MKRILEDREKRFIKILSLYDEYKLLVLVGKINYPGNNKNTLEAETAFNVLYSLLIDRFKKYTIHSEVDEGFDGKSLILILKSGKFVAKDLAIEIEETHPLGRIFDIDVYEGENSISRRHLGYPERKCIVCNNNARECAREGRHGIEEVLTVINSKIKVYTSSIH